MDSFRRLATGSFVATCVLVAIGGLVRATKSGLGCGDDWPDCGGRLIPALASRAEAIEFSHRAAAGIVVVLLAGLALMAVRRFRSAPGIMWAAVGAFGTVIVQALMGAAVVIFELRASLVVAHLAIAMTLLALLVYVMAATAARQGALSVEGDRVTRSVVGSEGRWTLYAAMDPQGIVDLSNTGPDLLTADAQAPLGARTNNVLLGNDIARALADSCTSLVVDQGDLARADVASIADSSRAVAESDGTAARDRALLAADDILGSIMARLEFESDLLLVISPTSPSFDDDPHLGVAVAVGPGFSAGSELSSASTGREGVVTLVDVAPTILAHLDLPAQENMVGRAWQAEGTTEGSLNDRLGAAVSLDRESVFAAEFQTPVVVGYIAFQVFVYAGAVIALRRGRVGLGHAAQACLLAIVAFPAATYLTAPLEAAELGHAGFAILLAVVAAVLVGGAWLVSEDPLGRLLAITLFTFVLLAVDLVLGGPMQLNSVLGNYLLHGGRFSGLGNNGFSVLGSSAIVAGALLVEARWDSPTLSAVAALFVAAILIDGLPMLGSDVGGVIALVPALVVTYLLLGERRPGVKTIAVALLVAAGFLVLFAMVDLARPEEARTHLGRLVEDVRERGFEPLWDAIGRKIETNLSVFRETFFTYLVPPVLAAVAIALLRNEVLARYRPQVRKGLIGLLLLAILGFATNDSGIVIPSLILSFLVPLALLARLSAPARP